jgi:hypothetical protein
VCSEEEETLDAVEVSGMFLCDQSGTCHPPIHFDYKTYVGKGLDIGTTMHGPCRDFLVQRRRSGSPVIFPLDNRNVTNFKKERPSVAILESQHIFSQDGHAKRARADCFHAFHTTCKGWRLVDTPDSQQRSPGAFFIFACAKQKGQN